MKHTDLTGALVGFLLLLAELTIAGLVAVAVIAALAFIVTELGGFKGAFVGTAALLAIMGAALN